MIFRWSGGNKMPSRREAARGHPMEATPAWHRQLGEGKIIAVSNAGTLPTTTCSLKNLEGPMSKLETWCLPLSDSCSPAARLDI